MHWGCIATPHAGTRSAPGRPKQHKGMKWAFECLISSNIRVGRQILKHTVPGPSITLYNSSHKPNATHATRVFFLKYIVIVFCVFWHSVLMTVVFVWMMFWIRTSGR